MDLRSRFPIRAGDGICSSSVLQAQKQILFMELSPCVGWCRAGVWRWCRSNAGEVGWQPREQRLGPHTFPEHPQGRAVAVSAQGEQKGGDGSALSLMRRSSSCECCRQPAPHRRPQPVLIMYPVSLINLLLFFLSFCVFTSFLSLSQGGGASTHLTWGGKVPLAHLVSDCCCSPAVTGCSWTLC